MKSERVVKGILGTLATLALVYLSTTFTYDSDDVLSTSNYNDTVGPILFFALILGIYTVYQFYQAFFGKK
jgi:hypothetical protein